MNQLTNTMEFIAGLRGVRFFLPIGLSVLACAGLTSCSAMEAKPCCAEAPSWVTVLGYGTKSRYRHLPDSEQALLAMRDAKEDAFRNLLERAGVISVKYVSRLDQSKARGPEKTSAFSIESSGKLQGVRLAHLVPVDRDIYEAKLEADLNSVLVQGFVGPDLILREEEGIPAEVGPAATRGKPAPYRYLAE